MRLLIVEDNAELAKWLRHAMRQQDYAVDVVANGADADYVLRSERYDAVILDLELPAMRGTEVLRRMRQRGDETPVLILTANSSLQSRVGELDRGADDYVSKPFELPELEARLRRVIRRANGTSQTQLQCGDLHFDSTTREFLIGSTSLSLTPRERSVLEVLIRSIGKTVSKRELVHSVFTLQDEATTDAIEIYVHRVRKKLEASSARVITLRGLGYVLKEIHDPA